MHFDINLRFQPSQWFIGILAELNERYSEWTDGSYDWANQTVDFLHNTGPLPQFDQSLLNTPLSQRAINDVLQVTIALLGGDYPRVRDYLKETHFAFVVGYPRSGGSYLTKELLRTVGFDHTRVSEALAHDGFPELREQWYDWAGNKPYFHLQHSVFQAAEFLVISQMYYRRKSQPRAQGNWFVPKKMHRLVAWAGSFKMLLGPGRADYLVTLRHPLPAAVSVAEKSGGMPDDGRFPAEPRSAIERWVRDELALLGYDAKQVAALDYIEAVTINWSHFYTRMATSGLFLGGEEEVRVVPYGKDALEGVISNYRQRLGDDPALAPEPVLIHDKAEAYSKSKPRCDEAVAAVSATWKNFGLEFPELSYD